jgi:hypothetical protein
MGIAARDASRIVVLLAVAGLASACGGPSQGQTTPALEASSEDEPLGPPTWDLRFQVQYEGPTIDEAIGEELRLDAHRLREFQFERRGDVGDGNEAVRLCEGTLTDGDREALREALRLDRWREREGFTVTLTADGGFEQVWFATWERVEGEALPPVPRFPPRRRDLEAMVPVLHRLLGAIRRAEIDATCTERVETFAL